MMKTIEVAVPEVKTLQEWREHAQHNPQPYWYYPVLSAAEAEAQRGGVSR